MPRAKPRDRTLRVHQGPMRGGLISLLRHPKAKTTCGLLIWKRKRIRWTHHGHLVTCLACAPWL